jgi:hypothetical protein
MARLIWIGEDGVFLGGAMNLGVDPIEKTQHTLGLNRNLKLSGVEQSAWKHAGCDVFDISLF